MISTLMWNIGEQELWATQMSIWGNLLGCDETSDKLLLSTKEFSNVNVIKHMINPIKNNE